MSYDWTCCRCGRAEDRTLDARGKVKVELRPYGPDGAPICFECAMKPANIGDVKRRFVGLLAFAGDAALLTEAGPVKAPDSMRREEPSQENPGDDL